VVVKRERGKGGEMAQTMYANMNKWILKKVFLYCMTFSFMKDWRHSYRLVLSNFTKLAEMYVYMHVCIIVVEGIVCHLHSTFRTEVFIPSSSDSVDLNDTYLSVSLTLFRREENVTCFKVTLSSWHDSWYKQVKACPHVTIQNDYKWLALLQINPWG
jgi:predicted membrane protein